MATLESCRAVSLCRGADKAGSVNRATGPSSFLSFAIPIDEALPIAKQIAEALEAAHEQGIIHRDLKPANIKVRADGTVKVLDFGLAKAIGADAASAAAGSPSMSPTITSPAMMTGAGMILGTAAYMAPEQAKGRAVDRRADIWAFGVVVYEMLTGKGLFAAEDVSETLAAVLTRTVDLAALPAATPPRVRRPFARCLDRDPRMRLRDIGEARVEIEKAIAGVSDGAEDSATPTSPKSRTTTPVRVLPWAVTAAALAAAAALAVPAVQYLREAPPPESRADIVTPATTRHRSPSRATDGISSSGPRAMADPVCGCVRLRRQWRSRLQGRRARRFRSGHPTAARSPSSPGMR